MEITRKKFLAGACAACTAAALPTDEVQASVRKDSWASLIDLTRCDGCKDRNTPACVESCRKVNADRFPEPDPKMLKPYWPRKFFEDYSTPERRQMINRLTPYNWIYVQRVRVEHEGEMHEVAMPRRCMHCDNPPCAKLCPFGVKHKDPEGPVWIDHELCFGGAKCRDVCPWNIPQRQAGVGIYTKLDPLPAGGGVLYKCDSCREKLKDGEIPLCASDCPQEAVTFGRREEIYALAEKLKSEYNGYIYGATENGGTSTLYISKVPFEVLDRALVERVQSIEDTDRRRIASTFINRFHNPQNVLEKHSSLAWGAVVAPIAGAVGALVATIAASDKKKKAKASMVVEPTTVSSESPKKAKKVEKSNE